MTQQGISIEQLLDQEEQLEAGADGGTVGARIAGIVGSGFLAAIVSSLPSALRMGGRGSFGLALEQWLALTAVSIPLAVLAVAVVGRARVGAHHVAGRRGTSLVIALLWSLVTELGLLSIFGTVLRKTTHHHALAGVTFAMFAVVSGALVALFARRIALLLAQDGSPRERQALALGGGASALAVLIIGFRMAGVEELHTTPALVDAVLLVTASVIASSRIVPRPRTLMLGASGAAVVVILAGLAAARLDSELQQGLLQTSPVFSFVSGLFDA